MWRATCKAISSAGARVQSDSSHSSVTRVTCPASSVASNAGLPNDSTKPPVGFRRPAMRRRSVLFPAPLAPTSSSRPPRGTERVTPRSTGGAEGAYAKVAPLRATADMLAEGRGRVKYC
eukprot:scaffold9776_cov126-Isochrysis_galbana.AAC.1